MRPLPKWVVLWTLIALLLLVLCLAHGGPSQGDGARALLKKSAATSPPPLPPKMLLAPGTNVLYFAATATDVWGLTSLYSAELVWVNTNRAQVITLGWDASPGTNQITNYTVYQGRTSGVYTNSADAGTNLTASLRIVPAPKTNVVITVTSVNATNLQFSDRLTGGWSLLNATNLTVTNPPVRMFFRPLGVSKSKPARAFVTEIVQ